jgi:hypothetical protein
VNQHFLDKSEKNAIFDVRSGCTTRVYDVLLSVVRQRTGEFAIFDPHHTQKLVRMWRKIATLE